MITRHFPPETPLGEVMDWLAANVEEGVQCPCCEQHAKVYKRKLNSGMARSLVWLVINTSPGEWIEISHAPNFIHKNREHSKLAHWGILEQQACDDTKKKDSGIWRVTDFGRDFAHERATTFSHVYLYNNHVLGFTTERVTVVDALGKDFDFQELMNATPDGRLK